MRNQGRTSNRGVTLSPPYAPWSETRTTLHKLRAFRPPRVDMGFLQTHGIAPKNERAVLNTLKYLGLIDGNGVPTEKLSLLSRDNGEYARNLALLVKEAYADLFRKIDLKDASPDMVNNYFLTQRVSPTVAPKCTRLFLGLCRETGLEMSPDLDTQPGSTHRRLSPASHTGPAPAENHRAPHQGPPPPDQAKFLEAKLKLFEKLPNFDASWKPQMVKLVFKEFNKLADRLEEKLQETKPAPSSSSVSPRRRGRPPGVDKGKA